MSQGLCRIICYLLAAGVAVLLGYYGGLGLGLGWIVAAILAVIVFAVCAWGLPRLICSSHAAKATAERAEAKPFMNYEPAITAAGSSGPSVKPTPSAEATRPVPRKAPAKDATSASDHWSGGVTAASGAPGGERGQTGIKPTAALAEEAGLREGVGSWKYEGGAGAAPAAASAPEAAPAPTSEPKSTPRADETTGAEAEPPTLSGPRGGEADDLKKIKGVGPKLEGTLNELGFYHFDQIAAWTASEIAWVDNRLKFKGRIERDGWIEQARLLDGGGETDFSKKVDKGDVY